MDRIEWGLHSVLVSPQSSPWTIFCTIQRMYFPVMVSGISLMVTNCDGAAYSPMSTTQLLCSRLSSSRDNSAPGMSVMNAHGVYPVKSSETPTTMQLATGDVCRSLSRNRLASIYPVPTRCPLTFSTSSDRPCIEKRPGPWKIATSP